MKRLSLLLFVTLFPVWALAQNVGGEIHRPQQQQSQPVRKPSKSVKSQQQISTNRTEASTTPAKNRDAIIQDLINNMVFVEGGSFMMGATPEQGTDAFDDEKPSHQIFVSSFSICKYEVTQELWETVMENNPSRFRGTKLPVEGVSWYECQEFIKKLNNLTGIVFRLPTEAEWEYAARGGKFSKGYKYAGSNTVNDVAWIISNYGDKTHEVGTKSPNELGLYDMSGNVFEWCYDWYYDESRSKNLEMFGNRVYRGGSWYFDARYCRVSYRAAMSPNKSSKYIGFRLAL